MSAAAAFLALAVLGATPGDGFVRPKPSTLSTIFGARWKIDVAQFVLDPKQREHQLRAVGVTGEGVTKQRRRGHIDSLLSFFW